MTSYQIYTHRRNANVMHNFQGTLILLGGMLFILGFVLAYLEMAIAGTGIIVLAGVLSVCDLNDPYHVDAYYGRDQDELEGGPVSE